MPESPRRDDDWLGREGEGDPSSRTGGLLPKWFHAPPRPGEPGGPDMWPVDVPVDAGDASDDVPARTAARPTTAVAERARPEATAGDGPPGPSALGVPATPPRPTAEGLGGPSSARPADDIRAGARETQPLSVDSVATPAAVDGPSRLSPWPILGVGVFLGVVLFQLSRSGEDRREEGPKAPTEASAPGTSDPSTPSAPSASTPVESSAPAEEVRPGPTPATTRPASPAPTATTSTPDTTSPPSETVASEPSPFPAGTFGVWVVGKDAEALAAAAEGLLASDRAFRPPGLPGSTGEGAPPRPRVALRSGSADAPVPAAAAALVEVHDGALVLRSAAPAEHEVRDRVDATRPLTLAGPALEGVRLEVQSGLRAVALASLAALLAGDAAGADDVLAEGSRDVGVRVLIAFANLGLENLGLVHASLAALEDDVDVGPLARFLTGAALLADGNPNEAIRDLRASGEARPFWPARLFQAFAEHGLALHEEAIASYDAVLEAVPGRPEAVVGRAMVVARRDPAAALEALRALVARRPDVAAAHGWIAKIHGERDGVEDRRLEVAALERFVELRPKDPAAWHRLASARFRWARQGGGSALLVSSAEAYAREAALSPESGLAWYSRGVVLHQLAIERTKGPVDVGTVRSRLADAAEAYSTALVRGLAGMEAARAHFQLALVRASLDELLGARAALEAALAADPDYAPAALELAALAVAEGSPASARRELARVPAGADDENRALLEAAIAWLEGRPEDVRTYVVRVARVTPGKDVLPWLARFLTVQGWPHAARALIPEGADAPRLVERIRASARLFDAASVRRDLGLLRAADPASAAALASSDDVRGLVGD